MAQPIYCNVCDAAPGVLLLTNLGNGEVLAFCAADAPRALVGAGEMLESGAAAAFLAALNAEPPAAPETPEQPPGDTAPTDHESEADMRPGTFEHLPGNDQPTHPPLSGSGPVEPGPEQDPDPSAAPIDGDAPGYQPPAEHGEAAEQADAAVS